jgi:hypothetical protein
MPFYSFLVLIKKRGQMTAKSRIFSKLATAAALSLLVWLITTSTPHTADQAPVSSACQQSVSASSSTTDCHP